jgi:hypothetical protein
MDRFNKITVGFVIQTFEKNDKGEFVCVSQEFIAGEHLFTDTCCVSSFQRPFIGNSPVLRWSDVCVTSAIEYYFVQKKLRKSCF